MLRSYKTKILGITYEYVGASRQVLEEALHITEQADMEDFLVERCVLSPKIDLETSYAGIITTLSEEILKVSGMTDEGAKEFQKEAEEWLISPAGKLECLMMGVFHKPLEEIQNLDPPNWHKSAAAAQLLAASLYGMDVEKFIEYDPNKPQVKGRRKTTTMPPPILQ